VGGAELGVMRNPRVFHAAHKAAATEIGTHRRHIVEQTKRLKKQSPLPGTLLYFR
jgi:hypothetical protein